MKRNSDYMLIKNIFSQETNKKIDKVFAETKQIFKDNPEITTQFINSKGTYVLKVLKNLKINRYLKKNHL